VEAAAEERPAGHGADRLGWALSQIVVLDIIFSLDSVFTAVGMAQQIWVIVVAMVLAVGVMLAFSGPVSAFVHRHPTMQMLTLSFLILIGVMLVAEGIEKHVERGYIYFAMAFALAVELLNLRVRKPAAPSTPNVTGDRRREAPGAAGGVSAPAAAPAGSRPRQPTRPVWTNPRKGTSPVK
jgi:predicted tellurium resistance membrane protein TerC